MAAVTLEINAPQAYIKQPLIWRLGKLYNVVTKIKRARATEDYGYFALELEGSSDEVEMAAHYLRSLGVAKGGQAGEKPTNNLKPEDSIKQPNAIYVRLDSVNGGQSHAPLIYRIGKDFDAVVTVERAAFDEEEGGSVEIVISGALIEVQRAIAFLHTTGLHVNPRQRSVTDYSNL